MGLFDGKFLTTAGTILNNTLQTVGNIAPNLFSGASQLAGTTLNSSSLTNLAPIAGQAGISALGTTLGIPGLGEIFSGNAQIPTGNGNTIGIVVPDPNAKPENTTIKWIKDNLGFVGIGLLFIVGVCVAIFSPSDNGNKRRR